MPIESEFARVDPAAVPARLPRTRSLGVLAVFGTLMLLGVGHLVVGRWRRAAAWILAYVLTVVGTFLAMLSTRPDLWLAVALLVSILATLACAVDAYRSGRRSTMLARLGWPSYCVVLIGVLVLIVFNPMAIITSRALIDRPMVEAFVMPTPSMEPTVGVGERILVNKLREPERRDVVAFHSSDPTHAVYIRRVIGMPGDRIEVSRGTDVYVNGQAQRLAAWDVSVNNAPSQYRPYVPVPPNNAAQGHPVVLGPGSTSWSPTTSRSARTAGTMCPIRDTLRASCRVRRSSARW